MHDEKKVHSLDVWMGFSLGLLLAILFWICGRAAWLNGYANGIEFAKAYYQVAEYDAAPAEKR